MRDRPPPTFIGGSVFADQRSSGRSSASLMQACIASMCSLSSSMLGSRLSTSWKYRRPPSPAPPSPTGVHDALGLCHRDVYVLEAGSTTYCAPIERWVRAAAEVLRGASWNAPEGSRH